MVFCPFFLGSVACIDTLNDSFIGICAGPLDFCRVFALVRECRWVGGMLVARWMVELQ